MDNNTIVKMHPGLAAAVTRLQGTSRTENLFDEMISAWMKTRKIIQENQGESCIAAPLFMKKIFEWFNSIDDNGKPLYYYEISEFYTFKFDSVTMEIVKSNDATDPSHAININHYTMDSLVCLCMGYIPNTGHNVENFLPMVENIGIYLWHVINTEKFAKYLNSCKACWRNPNTWKSIHNCEYDYRIDISRDRDLDLSTFFETLPQPLECSLSHYSGYGLNLSIAQQIRNIFEKNSKFFAPFDQDGELSISENYYLDLWFQYVWNPSLKRCCYENS